jgi:pyruvate-ferredoxin/flavodoxin oxidoreductase
VVTTATVATTVPTTVPDQPGWAVLDGNEAAASVAYALSDVVAIYPITPASPMGEFADSWSGAGRPNLFGAVPDVIEMQSEAGAAGALHGAATTGALATTFTASQGLLLMLPNMFKLAGELTPAVIHVAARTVATHALSIFGDHSDVMAARTTGWTMLASGSVQEAQDFAAVSHAVSLNSRLPVLHFFDGFRTSHEVAKIRRLAADDLHALVNADRVAEHRARGLTPDAPVLRGTAQNPDVFFQAREAANRYHDDVPDAVAAAFETLGERTGRQYRLVDYHGAPDAERVIVLMGSAAGTVAEAVASLVADGEKVGVATVRLFRPFPAAALLSALPETVRAVAVLDRTKEPGAPGEPLFLDVAATLGQAAATGRIKQLPRVIGGRYGLSSKEFTPAMAASVFDHASAVLADTLNEPGAAPAHGFTVGIVDDVTRLSLPAHEPLPTVAPARTAVFYGLGSDGTVSANKAAVKILGENTDLHTQGYFVYDSKKSGAVTVSHLRMSEEPIRSAYLVSGADFVACHQFSLLERMDVLGIAHPGATFLLNSPYGPNEVWEHLPVEVQEAIVEKGLRLFVIDAYGVSAEAGLRQRINSVMMPAFFALSGVLPADEALSHIRRHFEKTYARRGKTVVEQNLAAIDAALAALHEVEVPTEVTSQFTRRLPVPADAPDFVQRVTARMIAGEGDLLPVSALPVDGSFPTATAQYEKRTLALEIPIWDPDICIDCNKCAMVCPHTAIRAKVAEPAAFEMLRTELPRKDFRSRELPDRSLVIQVAPDDCTGCGICVDVCPARSKSEAKHKAINMEPIGEHLEVERDRFAAFLDLPEAPRDLVPHGTIKGSQLLQPLFEFSGACSGCGETPYLRLVSQLFGDRAIIANATGCSSIYGGNLPTTPWSVNADGRGPAWSNSLFEDNAEFGLGMRLALDQAQALAVELLRQLAPMLGDDAVTALISGMSARDDVGIASQRDRVSALKQRLADVAPGGPEHHAAQVLLTVADDLVHRSVWIVGGDGWAYDIGFSGLDHTLASGRDVNLLVLDTEVYSNTGGQASKSTPRAAVAKFATSGKPTPKKDLGMIAMAYGTAYVAQIALGANDVQTLRSLQEAEAYPGPSLVIAYSTCIAHGIEMKTSMTHQKDAVASGYWPLFRFRPGTDEHEHPFSLDSKEPSIRFVDFAKSEARFAMLARTHPEAAEQLGRAAQADIDERWRYYRQLAGLERSVTTDAEEAE